MNRFPKLLTAVIASAGLASLPALAETTWSPDREIETVTTDSEGNTIFVLEGTTFSGTGSCANKFRISVNDMLAAGKAQAVTSAQASGEKVSVSYFTDSTACEKMVMGIKQAD
ncbi:hypothetical protein [Henriciella algicola]|uniref:Uncharacterized protein n=1 Tax=Henriciella algicola TaxID=1608422 RepID=A0A399RE42_9PROT|nr:hypothetical protein [Henriciella algicola]RIJ29800.1 hypothetical protein D1222_08155 [Henriciella algicola]